eukprot:scaffold1513_cov100-Amphora_coffeaeformis.AAC.8
MSMREDGIRKACCQERKKSDARVSQGNFFAKRSWLLLFVSARSWNVRLRDYRPSTTSTTPTIHPRVRMVVVYHKLIAPIKAAQVKFFHGIPFRHQFDKTANTMLT